MERLDDSVLLLLFGLASQLRPTYLEGSSISDNHWAYPKRETLVITNGQAPPPQVSQMLHALVVAGIGGLNCADCGINVTTVKIVT